MKAQLLSLIKSRVSCTNNERPISSSINRPTNSSSIPVFGSSNVNTTSSIPNFGNGNAQSVQSVQQTTSSAISRPKMDLLRKLFEQNFGQHYKWEWFKVYGHTQDLYLEFTDFNIAEMPIDDELKAICLKVICHEQYTENDLIHLRINRELTDGWVLTYDSFCTGVRFGDNIFKYDEIQSVAKCINRVSLYNSFSSESSSVQTSLENFLNSAKKIISPNKMSNSNSQTPNSSGYISFNNHSFCILKHKKKQPQFII